MRELTDQCPVLSLPAQLLRCKALLLQKDAGFQKEIQSVSLRLIRHVASLHRMASPHRSQLYGLVNELEEIRQSQPLLSADLSDRERLDRMAQWRQQLPSIRDPPSYWDRLLMWRVAVYAQLDERAKENACIRGDGEWQALALAKRYQDVGLKTACNEILASLLQKKHLLVSTVGSIFCLFKNDISESGAKTIASTLCMNGLLQKDAKASVLLSMSERLVHHFDDSSSSSDSTESSSTAETGSSPESLLLSALNESNQSAEAWSAYARSLLSQSSRNYSTIVHALVESIFHRSTLSLHDVYLLVQCISDISPEERKQCLPDIMKCPPSSFLPFLPFLFSPERPVQSFSPLLESIMIAYPQESWYYLYSVVQLVSPSLRQNLPFFHPLQGRYVLPQVGSSVAYQVVECVR